LLGDIFTDVWFFPRIYSFWLAGLSCSGSKGVEGFIAGRWGASEGACFLVSHGKKSIGSDSIDFILVCFPKQELGKEIKAK